VWNTRDPLSGERTVSAARTTFLYFMVLTRRRDFLVNMAGCEWGRDCWGEMYNFRQLSNHLNRGRWEKFADSTRDYFKRRKEAKQAKQPQQQQ